MKFVFFSKSMYDEVPRIRHQLAALIASYNHKVVFYQKPIFFYKSNNYLKNKVVSDLIETRQTKQLIHHQLRLNRLLSWLNSHYEVRQIKISATDIKDEDVIINFNYDYYFLRKIFKKNKIITLINDDFVAQAKFRNGAHVLEALEKTCTTSDAVLCVSNTLHQQCKTFNPNSFIFLPWAQGKYTYNTKASNKSNKILLWAHIDRRIDFDLLKYSISSLKDYEFHIYGPIDKKLINIVNSLESSFKNVFFHTENSLLNIDLSNCFCTIIPYKENIPDIKAVTASNKTFQLLSKGLPIVTYGMPNFLEHKSIYKAKNYNDFIKGIKTMHSNHNQLQNCIDDFVSKNLPENRYFQLFKIIFNPDNHV